MAGKTTAKPKVKNGINKQDPVLSMTTIDGILTKMSKFEKDIDDLVVTIDDFCLDELKETQKEIVMRVEKVEARLGIG